MNQRYDLFVEIQLGMGAHWEISASGYYKDDEQAVEQLRGLPYDWWLQNAMMVSCLVRQGSRVVYEATVSRFVPWYDEHESLF